MKAAKIWVIPNQGTMRGGDLYDRYDNFEYFADTTALTEKVSQSVDVQISRKALSRSAFMRDPAPASVAGTTYNRSVGLYGSKGAYPGRAVVFVSDAGLPGEERRQFSWTGTMSALVAWLKTTANMAIDIHVDGTPYFSIPAATP